MSLAALDAKLEQLRSHYTPSKSDDRKSYMPRAGAMMGGSMGGSMGGMPMGGSMGSSMRRRLDPDQVKTVSMKKSSLAAAQPTHCHIPQETRRIERVHGESF